MSEEIELIEAIIKVCHGELGPETVGEYETDARYVYPEKLEWIEFHAKKVLSILKNKR